jgi:hypothetical protein
MQNELKNELHHIISGKGAIRFGTTIQPIARYLNDGSPASQKTENTKQLKEQEAKRLEDYITKNNLWVEDVDFSEYVSEGN